MKTDGAAAVSSLVRWRAFREALAARDRDAAAAAVRAAETRRDAAEDAAAVIARRRETVLSAPHLDLSLLQAVATFETRAFDDLTACSEALAERVRTHADARDAQRRARADVRVAESRRDRLLAEAADGEEKRLFDRMASLMSAANGAPSDD